ncbi:MAG TPA: hypothetical protein VNV65_12730 [Candidatus Solibacter sp.]|jgi:hypothetical protein|nr:hypothetical protein [Candidatus Solibacter sp.]
MTVRIDLLPDGSGPYRLAVTARPEGLASPSDIDASSGDLAVGADEGRRSLVFEPWVPSPTGVDAVAAARPPIALVLLYQAKDEEAMAAFDERITEEYSAFYADRGVSYGGLCRVAGPHGSSLGELLGFEVPDMAVALRAANDGLSDRIVAIEDECRLYQDLDRPRYTIWMDSTVAQP